MGNVLSSFFPPTPELTEKNITSQDGKVYIVTGGYAGVGYQLCAILYHAGASVYMAGRDESKALKAIQGIRSSPATTPGKLTFLHVDLADLNTIKPAAEHFMRQESRLDVLFNNAGVSTPPLGSISKQGHELQLATNAVGPYLLTQLLSPILVSTARKSSSGNVRVTFTSSIVTDLGAPKGGLTTGSLSRPYKQQQNNYSTSKTANWFLADHFSKTLGAEGVLCTVLNPGNLHSELLRHYPWWVGYVVAPLLYHPKYGAYTNLYAGLSMDLTISDGGKWVEPWGRLHPAPREDIMLAMKKMEDGGTGVAEATIEHFERITEAFQ